MKRRGFTVLLGAILSGLLMWQISVADVPYVVLNAGPTFNTLGAYKDTQIIEVVGGSATDSKGELRMVTVGVQERNSIFDVLRSWWSKGDAVVPREMIIPPGKSDEEVEQANQEDFANSQSSAETAAFTKLGYPTRVIVGGVAKDGASADVIKMDDIVTAIDGTQVSNTEKMIEIIKAKPVGTALKVDLVREGKPQTVTVTTKAGDDGKSRIGVSAYAQPHPLFNVKIQLDDVGGPSAGLMFALGIIDKLSPEDLTGGKIIAGTGTIDDTGKVGPIGGIPQKLIGARAAGATYFLTPADNCAEAMANPVDGLTLVKVSSLDEGVSALASIREGKPLPGC